MADDRMKKDDLDRNMGGTGQNKGDDGQQTPGRHKPDDEIRTGQRGGAGQQNQPGRKENLGDDFGTSEKPDVGQGGRNR